MKLDKGMEFTAGTIHAMVYGGSFIYAEQGVRRVTTVKMAREISMPCDIGIPTTDFSVPDVDDLIEGVRQAIYSMAHGNDIYVGCMGGVGRTGLFMATLAKVMFTYNNTVGKPVEYVRESYNSHAVETAGQWQYLQDLDVSDLVAYVGTMQIGRVIERDVVREVVKFIERPSLWQRFKNYLFATDCI